MVAPTIEWAAKVGRLRWKNVPLAFGDLAISGSAGSADGERSPGVYALERRTGELRWHFRCTGAVNSICVAAGLLVFGTLDGMVHCISAESGRKRWSTPVGVPVVASPTPTAAGFVVFGIPRRAIVLSSEDGRILDSSELPGTVVADPVPTDFDFAAFSREGDAVFIDRANGDVAIGAPLTYESDLGERRRAGVVAELTRFGDGFVIPFVRDTTYEDPPLVCVTGGRVGGWRVTWRATRRQRVGQGFGNLRMRPVAWNAETLIVCGAYSNEAYAIDARGQWKWSCPLGYEAFPQWGGPEICGESVLVPRNDGFLHQVDPVSGKRLLSLYLGRQEAAGLWVNAEQRFPNADVAPWWQDVRRDPLVGRPTVIGDTVIQGSEEGWLYCISGLAVRRE